MGGLQPLRSGGSQGRGIPQERNRRRRCLGQPHLPHSAGCEENRRSRLAPPSRRSSLSSLSFSFLASTLVPRFASTSLIPSEFRASDLSSYCNGRLQWHYDKIPIAIMLIKLREECCSRQSEIQFGCLLCCRTNCSGLAHVWSQGFGSVCFLLLLFV